MACNDMFLVWCISDGVFIMKQLKFINPTFNKHFINYTVRKGLKWSKEVEAGGIIALIDVHGNIKGLAEIQTIITCKYKHIPREVYTYAHDPECHSPYGMLKAMKKAYETIKTNDVVTCIGFRPIGLTVIE